MSDIKALDLQIHINGMKQSAKLLMKDAEKLKARSEEIQKQAIELEFEFIKTTNSVNGESFDEKIRR